MNVQTTVNNKVTELLNAWYIEIRNRNVANAYKFKKEIESSINNIEEDQNLLLYYSLLDFGYKYLIDNLSIAKNSFDQIESFDKPTDDFLSYYYNFYKAIYSNAVGNYNAAKEHYEIAEKINLKVFQMKLKKQSFIITKLFSNIIIIRLLWPSNKQQKQKKYLLNMKGMK